MKANNLKFLLKVQFYTNILQFFHNFIVIIAFLIIQTATSLIQTSKIKSGLVFY